MGPSQCTVTCFSHQHSVSLKFNQLSIKVGEINPAEHFDIQVFQVRASEYFKSPPPPSASKRMYILWEKRGGGGDKPLFFCSNTTEKVLKSCVPRSLIISNPKTHADWPIMLRWYRPTFCFFPNSVLIPNTTSTGFTEPSVSHVDQSSLLATLRSETIRAVDQRTSSVDCVALGPPKIAFVSFKRTKKTAATYNINVQHKYYSTVFFTIWIYYLTVHYLSWKRLIFTLWLLRCVWNAVKRWENLIGSISLPTFYLLFKSPYKHLCRSGQTILDKT